MQEQDFVVHLGTRYPEIDLVSNVATNIGLLPLTRLDLPLSSVTFCAHSCANNGRLSLFTRAHLAQRDC